MEESSGLPPLAQPFGCLQAGFLWKVDADSAAILSLSHIPPLPIPPRLEYPLGSRMHLGIIHPRPGARGRPFPRSPRSRVRVNLRVRRPLTQGPQGQPSRLPKPDCCPGVQGIFSTSRGKAPHGWPMNHHSMETGSPIPRGCCSVFSATPPTPLRSPATSLSPVPRPVTHLCLFPAPLVFPFPMGLLCGPSHWPCSVPSPSPVLPCFYPTGPPATL